MEKETEVWMRTNLGDIRLKLYNDTPLHRDNFLKLVDDGTCSTASSANSWCRVVM